MRRWTVAVVGVAVGLAACASSGGSSSGGGASAPGVTATEIHVGGIDYKTFYGDGETGARARIARLNASGGVWGRKIVLDQVVDDGADANQDVNAAKTLVNDKVFAVLPVLTAAFSGEQYLEQQKVPFFGWSIQPVWCQQTYGFGFEGADCQNLTLPQTSDATSFIAPLFPDGQVKGKTIALISEDNDSATKALKAFGALWEANGAKVVVSDSSMPSPPAVVGDYTPFAEKIMTGNGGKPADLVETVLSVADTLGLFNKLNALGYPGVQLNFSLYDPRVAAATKNLVTFVNLAPFEAASTVPAVKQMITDLQAQDPKVVLSQPAAAGYWSADLFIAMLQKVGRNLTRQSFMQVANGNFSWNYGGAAQPVTFPEYHTLGPGWVALVRSNGKTFDIVHPYAEEPLVPNPLAKK